MKDLKANYTVETTLVFGMLIMILSVGVYTTFYWYNRVTIASKSHEKAIALSHKQVAGWGIKNDLEKRLFATSSVSAAYKTSASQIIVTMKAEMNIPYIKQSIQILREAEIPVAQQTEYIKMMRKIERLIGDAK